MSASLSVGSNNARGIGVARVAMFLFLKALSMAEVVAVSPAQYTAILWATALGDLVWGYLPDLWIRLGTAMILLSGLYAAYGERKTMERSSDNGC